MRDGLFKMVLSVSVKLVTVKAEKFETDTLEWYNNDISWHNTVRFDMSFTGKSRYIK